MNSVPRILLICFLTLFVGTVAAEVVIKQRPLTWDDVAGMDGAQMYGTLCASCHGIDGKGDGPAVPALEKAVPDLTHLASQDHGYLNHARIEMIIAGKNRELAHGEIGMPQWEDQFKHVRFGWNDHQRSAFARRKINALADHVETLQVVSIDD